MNISRLKFIRSSYCALRVDVIVYSYREF